MAFGELQSFGTSSGLRLGAVVEYYDLNVENSGCAPFGEVQSSWSFLSGTLGLGAQEV